VISESAQAFVEARTVDGVAAAKAQFAHPRQLARLEKWHGDKARWILDAWFGIWLDPEHADWTLAPDLPAVTCPVLVIHGTDDEFGSDAFPEMIASAAKGPTEQYILDGVGHMPHREKPALFLELVTAFLDRQGL
jgi:pimeloyl-ACP methyl ester carboxylesterase